MKKLTFILIATLLSNVIFAQEVLIIGTMHTVPKIAKNSYKPLLRIAKSYSPQLIMVEEVMPQDTLSQAFVMSYSSWSKKFFELSDSLRKTREIPSTAPDLRNAPIDEILDYFALTRDVANYGFYKYVKEYGPTGSKKPLRNESYDLNYKLALALGHSQVYAVDNHHYEAAYQKAIRSAWSEGQKNGNVQAYQKTDKKTNNQTVWAVLGGRWGKCINSPKHLQMLHNINTFECAVTPTEITAEVSHFWSARNAQIAKNIAEAVSANGTAKNLVVIGAGHVVSLKAELERQYPDIKVKLISDL